MSSNYLVEKIGRITAVRFTLTASSHDLLDAANDVAQLENNTLRLWDLRKGVSVSTADIFVIARRMKEIGFPSSKIAVLVTDKLSYGLARMFDVHREQDNQKYNVFEREQEAVKWLLE